MSQQKSSSSPSLPMRCDFSQSPSMDSERWRGFGVQVLFAYPHDHRDVPNCVEVDLLTAEMGEEV